MFSSAAYQRLDSEDVENSSEVDLKAHLTNTSLQTELGESNVRLLEELEGCTILSDENKRTFKKADMPILISQVKDVLVETFRAALQNPVHFQVIYRLTHCVFTATENLLIGSPKRIRTLWN